MASEQPSGLERIPGRVRPDGTPTVTDETSRPLLTVTTLSKDFPGTRALDAVSLDVLPGEIYALCGGNGSGKSTLIKILAGVEQGEPGGTIKVGDVTTSANTVTPAFAHGAGIRVVHQDLGVFPDLTVAENIALGAEFPRRLGGRIAWRDLRRRAQEMIDRFDIRATPRTLLRDLNRATQTEVAIARALQGQEVEHGGILILDEPTTALPAAEVDLLLESLRRFADAGQSIMYVSHRLDEILRLTDRVTVLRDGHQVGTYTTSSLDENSLIEAILGKSADRVFVSARRSSAPAAAAPRRVLDVTALDIGPLRGASLHVDSGEIVGVAGLLGSGRTTLLRAIFGDLPIEGGEIRLDGKLVRFRDQRAAMDAGVAMIPENRAQDAAFLDQPLAFNLGISVLGDYWKNLHIRTQQMHRDAEALMERFGIKSPSPALLMSGLSGGNQQKAVLARWLRRNPRLLLLDEPTQGVDVGARADIYRQIAEAAETGMAVLVVASDFEELAHVVDRAVIIGDGLVRKVVDGDDLRADRIAELVYTEGMLHAHSD